jgi:uncharacterized protein YcbX
MSGIVISLFRHLVKGFTPERIEQALLTSGAAFPGDRLYALEDGPCGFDLAAPGFIPKQRFAVLAKIAAVARARTRFDDATGLFTAEAEGLAPLAVKLDEPEGQEAFAAWMTALLGDEAKGPLRLIDGRGHRFLDHPSGHVSIINLASVRDLEAKLGQPIDPLRFRANLYVEGWAPWAENDWTGRRMRLGDVEAEVFKPIVRCAATGVDPTTAIRDLDIPAALFRLYGHLHCGIYVQVTRGGIVHAGDPIGEAA